GELGLQLLGPQRLLDQAGLGRGELGRACREHRLALGQERVLGNELPPKLLDLSVLMAGASTLLRAHPARVGCHVRCGARQSMPSSNIDSCAGVSVTEPSFVTGHTKRPFSSRLANRQKPCPSQ